MPECDRGADTDHDKDFDGDADEVFLVYVIVVHIGILHVSLSGWSRILILQV